VDQAVEVLLAKGRIKESFSVGFDINQSLKSLKPGQTHGLQRSGIKNRKSSQSKDLCYRLHLAVDVKSELPIAMIVVSANENEKKHLSLRFIFKYSIIALSCQCLDYSCFLIKLLLF
jgi:hypothetical protein